jgi:hypothetical protein
MSIVSALLGIIVLKMNLTNMSALRNVNPIKAEIGYQGDADQKQQDAQADDEFDDFPVKC